MRSRTMTFVLSTDAGGITFGEQEKSNPTRAARQRTHMTIVMPLLMSSINSLVLMFTKVIVYDLSIGLFLHDEKKRKGGINHPCSVTL